MADETENQTAEVETETKASEGGATSSSKVFTSGGNGEMRG